MVVTAIRDFRDVMRTGCLRSKIQRKATISNVTEVRLLKHRNGRATALLALFALAACEDSPTQQAAQDVVAVAAVGDNSGSDFGGFEPLTGSAQCVAPPATLAEFATYQPFVLPAGFQQTIVADESGDFRPVAGTGGAGISLVGHHEVLIPLIAAAVIEMGP